MRNTIALSYGTFKLFACQVQTLPISLPGPNVAFQLHITFLNQILFFWAHPLDWLGLPSFPFDPNALIPIKLE